MFPKKPIWFLAVLTTPLSVLSILLLWTASTLAGRLMGLSGVALTTGLVFFLFGMASPRDTAQRKRFLASAALGEILLVVCWGICYSLAPDGKASADAPFQQYYLNGGHFRRAALSNLVPEADQFNLGMALFPLLDNSLSGEKGRKIQRDYQAVYAEMEQDPAFHALGSNMRYAYAEFLPGNFDGGHLYVYTPPRPNSKVGDRLPVLLFLHGSMGNFKGYMWVLKSVADASGCAVVAPSFGLGNWNRDGGTAAIERARQWCVSQPNLDPERIFLVCLSNGGRGLVRAAIQNPQGYKGLISISGYLEHDLVESSSFLSAWRDRPVLVLQGEKDDRVLPTEVRRNVEIMNLGGIRVTAQFYPEADHFLFFSNRREVKDVIGKWLRETGGSPPM